MAFRLEYLDEVLTDIQEAKAWYKEQREGLEEEFGTTILQAIERILSMPSAYRIRDKFFDIVDSKIAIHRGLNW
jgi:hypothetical protein